MSSRPVVVHKSQAGATPGHRQLRLVQPDRLRVAIHHRPYTNHGNALITVHKIWATPHPTSMSHWFSPFPLPEIVVVQLEHAGLEPVTELSVEQEEPVLLLYNTPDRLLATTDLEGSALLDGYRTLLAAPATSPRLTVWRLAALDAGQLGKILSGDPPPEFSADLPPPEPEPLAALVTAAVCRSVPGLLDAYLDLELQVLLGGGEPDSAYLRRLQSRISSEGLLQAWRSPGALAHQVADLREQLAQSNGLLEDNQKALAKANQKLEQQDTSLKEAREEAELTLLQLHQVQEELESYFVRLSTSEQLAASQAEALQQAEATGQEQAARLEALEAEVLQISRERDDAVLGRDQLIEALENQLSEAREEAELTLLNLHQVQEVLESYFVRLSTSEHLAASQAEALQQAEATGQEQATRLEALEAEVLQISRERDDAVLGRDQLIEALENQLSEAREEAELTLLQLNQVQEELEHNFLRSLASDQLVQAQFEQLQRAQRLMFRLHPAVVPTAPFTPALAVQVLPEVADAVPNQTLQTEALLNTYAASLQRASALLERARRS